MSRMFVQEVMAENARLFSVRHTRAIVLQRWWRWCRAFRRVERMKYAQIAPEIMKVYKHHRFKQREALEDKHMHMKVKAHYKHEIKQARGAFFTGGFALRCVVLRGVALHFTCAHASLLREPITTLLTPDTCTACAVF